jgi:ArsR family transcriptional regulator
MASTAPGPQAKTEASGVRRPSKVKDASAYAELLRALADDTRLSIILLLAATPGEMCVCDIEAYVKHLSQPTISHHLKHLREAGLVTAERRGTWVHYALDMGAVGRLREFVALLGG